MYMLTDAMDEMVFKSPLLCWSVVYAAAQTTHLTIYVTSDFAAVDLPAKTS